MFFLSNYLFGIFCIHIIWFYFFITGTLIHQNDDNKNQDTKIVDVAITSTSGIAITGFVLLLLGFSRQLNIYSFIFWLLIESLIFKFIKSQNPLGRYFWKSKISNFFKIFDIPATIIYLTFLIIAVPAVLPPTLWDSISYHLAYAVDWANAGRIYVDEFLRFPYYANNFVLIYSLMFILHLGQYCHFITWLAGLLSCLAIYGFISSNTTKLFVNKNLLKSNKEKFFGKIVGFIVTFSVIISPIFIRYVNVGLIDIPIGLFILIPMICAYLSIDNAGKNYEFDTVLNSAFCIGMKISNIVYLPLFALCVRNVCLRKRRKFLYILILCLLMLALSSPWYIRNYIEAGDPIPPVINLLLGKEDPIFSLDDYNFLMSDLKEQKGFWFLILIPFHFFIDPSSKSFREYGITSLILLIYLPIATLIIFLISKKIRNKITNNFIFINIFLLYLLLVWIKISYLGRYFLNLFPVYACYIGLCVFNIVKYFRERIIEVDIDAPRKTIKILFIKIFIILFLLTTLIPSPSSGAYYNYLISSNYINIKNYDDFLSKNLRGYSSIKTIVDLVKLSEIKDSQNPRVLTIRFENLAFYFRKKGLISMGDWFGPGRFKDIVDRVKKGTLESYMTDFNISYILIDKQEALYSKEEALRLFDQNSYTSFIQQIQQAGFIEINSPEKQTSIYAKSI